ncbi:MOSC domain-containing protein [Marinomonas sp. GJ51-6]|uniref:MOSC domain-containing protein n=1 Tax=Marinomonas sp. GJ51-6 TaxID=2992802 RepID=UPI002934CAC7|nr:MOSC domain-containing protein [Marinomonas sp. GJ51-6]WOD07440.1 MOSC domain-containing protein [Marinomonas sp. GJ51-6]
MTYSLSQLIIYPIKSIHGIALQTSQVNEAGLLGDRRYMLVTPDGDFITGREHPTLTLIKAKQLDDNSWVLSHPSTDTELTLNQAHLSDEHKGVVIWEEHLQGQVAKSEVNAWFSSIVDKPVEPRVLWR